MHDELITSLSKITLLTIRRRVFSQRSSIRSFTKVTEISEYINLLFYEFMDSNYLLSAFSEIVDLTDNIYYIRQALIILLKWMAFVNRRNITH